MSLGNSLKVGFNMDVLIACEFSGTVRDAFIKKGHNAISCDLLGSDITGPHITGDVLPLLKYKWDLMIAHPPCTYLANSGVQHMWKGRKKINGPCEQRWENMRLARIFFNQLLNADIEKIAVENPVPHGYAELTKYTQIVQPYFFGEEVMKKTCLWLKGLPNLEPTNMVGQGEKYITKEGKSNGSKWYQLPPSVDRWKHRSKTFQGIADAMAEQWG